VAASFPDRILVVRLGAIGDVVNALVFATALKEHRPALEIGWVVHELAEPLVAGHPSIDRTHVWKRGTGPAGLRALVAELRARRYELAVDLQRIAKSALVARLSGAARVLGFDRARCKEASWILTHEHIAPGDPGAHMVEQYLEVARHLGVDAPPRRLLPRDDEAARWADALIAELGAAPVQVSLGATKPANRWEPERFGELAAELAREHDFPVCLTGGPADREAAARALRAARGAPRVRSLVGETSLRQLCALSARARLFVGCDSGPMHVAAAQGTPVVALFGPADPRRTGPYGPGHRVVRAPPPCAPCNRRTCNQPRHACMEDIAVPVVLAAARAALSGVTVG
jgi:lipopolysaccharide heptosyltransferase II